MLNRGKYSNVLPVLGARREEPERCRSPCGARQRCFPPKKLPEAMEAYGMALALGLDLSLAHFGLGEVLPGCSETAPGL